VNEKWILYGFDCFMITNWMPSFCNHLSPWKDFSGYPRGSRRFIWEISIKYKQLLINRSKLFAGEYFQVDKEFSLWIYFNIEQNGFDIDPFVPLKRYIFGLFWKEEWGVIKKIDSSQKIFLTLFLRIIFFTSKLRISFS